MTNVYVAGAGGAAASSGKVTPIPLGPSSASPKAAAAAKPSRKPSLSTPVNNAVSENDDDYYLQRSDATDSRLQHDLLRGSSSGNFFSNKNRGVENPDDYEDTTAARSRAAAHAKDEPRKNAAGKAPFRKLLTGKKPVAESDTGASAAVASTTEAHRFSSTAAVTAAAITTTASAATTVRQPNYKATTYRSKDRGRVNYKTYLEKQAKVDEYDFQKVKTVSPSTTFAPAYQQSTRANPVTYQSSTQSDSSAYQSTQTNNLPYQSTQTNNLAYQQNTQANNLAAYTIFQQQQPNVVNGFQSNRIQAQPQQQVTAANNFQGNNNFQGINSFQGNNDFQGSRNFQGNNNYQGNNNFQGNQQNGFGQTNAGQTFQPQTNSNQQKYVQQNVNFNPAFQSEKVFPAAAALQNFEPQRQNPTSTSTTTTFQPYQTNQYQSTSTTQRYQTPVSYQQQQSSNFQSPNAAAFQQVQQQQQQFVSQPSSPIITTTTTTERFSKDFKAKFDPYNSYQRNNEEAGESLRTASSSHPRPSDLNALQIQAQAKPKTINATLSVGFSFNRADVSKSTVIVPAVPTTQKPRPFVATQPSTAFAAVSSTTTTASAAKPAANKKPVTKDKDSSYDYAYYDDSNHNDYTDVVAEDFSRIYNANKF